jgi:hypothetical protein
MQKFDKALLQHVTFREVFALISGDGSAGGATEQGESRHVPR